MQNLSTSPNGEMRQFERRPYTKTIDCSVSAIESKEQKRLNLKATTIDISNAGIGIKTDYPLKPGYMLWFNGGIEQEAGIVRWCIHSENNYRAGIRLDRECIKHIELLDKKTEAYMEQLREFELRCLQPNANKEKLLDELIFINESIIQACAEFEEAVGYDENLIKSSQIAFRERTNSILSKSYCINRTRTWPQGYQGDYKTLEGLYRNTPLSDGIGYYLDKYMLSLPLGVAVRGRIVKLRELLKEEIINRQKPKVLDIACGSCREVFELVPEIESSGAKFICIDLDSDALDFAADRLSYTSLSLLLSNQIEFRKYNALRLFDYELAMSDFGKQDIIYSVGFFDYLPSDFLVRIFETLYNLLNPGGRLIAAFKDANRYRHHLFHWIVDWDGFLQRNEEEFRTIMYDAGIPRSAISETREETGIIIFYIITK